jgi:hypothetical protein
MHDPLIRGLASNGKVKNAATRGPGFPWPGSAPQAGAFSGLQYLTVPLHEARGADKAITEAIDRHEGQKRGDDDGDDGAAGGARPRWPMAR